MHDLKLSEQLENDKSNTYELKRIEKGQRQQEIVQSVRQQEIHSNLQICPKYPTSTIIAQVELIMGLVMPGGWGTPRPRAKCHRSSISKVES